MSNALAKRISIFLTADKDTLHEYFNPHDPAPLYKRQLSYEFEQYLMTAVATAKRHSVIRYKLRCVNDNDEKVAEPLIHAIRRHFSVKEAIRKSEFKKFKRRTFTLLVISLGVVMLCQGFIPMILNEEHRIHSGLSNSLDVFSWVILWRPIDKLIFYWNPFLKDISILHKLTHAEVIVPEKHAEAELEYA